MNQVTLSIHEAKRIASALIDSNHYPEAIALLASIDTLVRDKIEFITSKIKKEKVAKKAKGARKSRTWTDEEKANRKALWQQKRDAKKAAQELKAQPETFLPIMA